MKQWWNKLYCKIFGHDWKNLTVDHKDPTFWCLSCKEEWHPSKGGKL